MLEHFKLYFLKFYSFSSILSIKRKNNKFVLSKFRVIFTLVFITLGVCYLITYTVNTNVRKYFYEDNVAELKQYSKLSNRLLILFYFLSIGGVYVLVLIQCKKFKKVLKFIDSILNLDELNEYSTDKYKKLCIKNLILLIFIQILCILPQFLAFIDYKKIQGLILHTLNMYVYFPTIAFVNFVYNFQLYMIYILRQISIQFEFSGSDRNVKKNLKKLRRVSEMFEVFHEGFGYQLTLTSVNFTFMITILVRLISEF